MNSLQELIGKEVTVEFYNEDTESYGSYRCKVEGVNINDFYFQEKNEPIYIEVFVNPVEETPDWVDEDKCTVILNQVSK